MNKKELTPQPLIPVRPILLVGVNVEGKANFFEVGSGGNISSDPPMVAMSIRHERYSMKAIFENRTFTINIPSVEMVKEADYCGIVSGAKTDKAKDCNFNIFYGKLGNAPMIEQCPINMECSLAHVLGSVSHLIVFGRVEATYVSEKVLIEGKTNWDKISPLLWYPNKSEYVAIGNTVGKTRNTGNALKTTP